MSSASYNGFISWMYKKISGFDFEKYWRMREYVISHNSGLLAWYYLFRIKRVDVKRLSSLGTHIGFNSATFYGKPYLPHGLNGIIISNDAVIGKSCQIYQQVTIGGGNGGAPIIGDNCLIGAGSKIIGPVHIGDNVKIGAGCVVAEDVPDNATVVVGKPRIIIKE